MFFSLKLSTLSLVLAVLFVLLRVAVSAENPATNNPEVKKLIEHYEGKVYDENISADMQFVLTARLAKDLHSIGYYDLARDYYQKALEQNIDRDKGPIHTNLMGIELNQFRQKKDNEGRLVDTIRRAEMYFKANPQYLSNQAKSFINFYRTHLFKGEGEEGEGKAVKVLDRRSVEADAKVAQDADGISRMPASTSDK